MITNDGPRERSDTSPRTRATTPAVTPATGTHTHGDVSGNFVASTPIV
jgi:hypothetical protein